MTDVPANPPDIGRMHSPLRRSPLPVQTKRLFIRQLAIQIRFDMILTPFTGDRVIQVHHLSSHVDGAGAFYAPDADTL